jgi:membrane fusion protein (multidrug efflux system)
MMSDRFIVLVWLASAAGCHPSAPQPRAAVSSSAPPHAVRTVEVVAVVGSGGFAPATVVARSRAVLSARTTAGVTALPFREGDRFASGAVLVRLDDRALRAAHAAAMAEDAAAGSDRVRAETLLAKGAATPREAEEARARAEGARAAVAATSEALAYSELRAPFTGTVAARPVHVGDVVAPGTSLLEIEGVDGLEVLATLDGREAAVLRPGMPLDATVDGNASPITATVRSVSAAGDPGTHRFEVRATLPTVPGLRSGLFARLALPSTSPRPDRRLVVPAASVFVRGGLTGVYVVSDGRARLRWVAAGAPVAGGTEVRAGLAVGERVVVDPTGLEDGAAVVEAHS